MGQYIIYDELTGKITKILICSESMLPVNIVIGEAYIEGSVNDSLFYVNPTTHIITAKTDFDFGDQSIQVNTELVISELPNPTTVRIDSQVYVVTDGSLELTFTNIGKYKATFISVTKVMKEIEIEVYA
jgi:hypothetical protein